MYFDGHLVTSVPGTATNVPFRSVPSTTMCGADLEQVGHRARVDDLVELVRLAADVLDAEVQPALVGVAGHRPDHGAGERDRPCGRRACSG